MLPKLNRIRNQKTSINTFRGINQSVNVGFSKISSSSSSIYTEFVNQKNISCDDYPALSVRKERSYIASDVNITSNIIIASNQICYIKNHDTLVIGDKEVTLSVTTTQDENLVLMGNNIIIYPNEIMLNISSLIESPVAVNFTGVFEEISTEDIIMGTTDENSWDFYRANIQKIGILQAVDVKPCFASNLNPIDKNEQLKSRGTHLAFANLLSEYKGQYNRMEYVNGNGSTVYKVQKIERDNTSGNDRLILFSEETTPYVQINCKGIGKNFIIGDWVSFSDIDGSNTSEMYKELNGDTTFADKLNGNYFKIYDKSDDYITIKLDLHASVDYRGPINVFKKMPSVDFVIENENRLWGCSNKNNEIYASKLGDATNWFAYGDGLSTDSYALTIGTEGEFTGIAKQNNAILFFKENWVHKIYGTKPSNYCLTTYNVPGVEKGSEKSLVWINGTLFYKSKYGVCLYSPGGTPTIISDYAFGNNKYINAVAGKYKHKYYISLLNTATNKYELYSYDTLKGIWNKEDDTQFINTVTYNDNLYFIDGKTNYIGSIDGKENLFTTVTNSELFFENPIEWEVETGNLYDNELNVKYINQLQILMELNEKSEVEIFIKTKVNGEYRQIKSIYAQDKRTVNYTFLPSRADFLQIRFKGRGKALLYQINIRYNLGSEKRCQTIM